MVEALSLGEGKSFTAFFLDPLTRATSKSIHAYPGSSPGSPTKDAHHDGHTRRNSSVGRAKD